MLGRFVPVCLVVILHRLEKFDRSNVIFETFLKCLPLGNPIVHCVFMKNGKESTLTDYHSFQDLSGKFSYSKAIHFFSFFFSLSL